MDSCADADRVMGEISHRRVKARVLSLAELSDRDRGAWRELSDDAVEPNPFFDPDFVLPAAAALDERNEVGILVVEAGDRWNGCMPVRRSRRWHRIPVSCLSTWRHLYCFLGTPLVRPEAEEETMAAMVSALRRANGSSCCALEWVAATGRLGDAIAAALPPKTIVFEDFDRAALDRRSDGEYLEGWVKSKDRREFRRRSRLLGEELGATPELVDHAGEAKFVEDFLALEGAGWKGTAGTALASDPAHAQFFREIAARFAARGALNLVFLRGGETQLAATCDLVAGGVDFCFKVAYDERFSRFAPGRDLAFKMIDYFHADPSLRTMDSCTAPDNDLYNRMWRDRRRLKTFAFGSEGLRGLPATPAIRLGMAIRDRRAAKAPPDA